MGPVVAVSGTTAARPDGGVVGEGDLAAQARVAVGRVVEALAALGATPADVLQTRIYVTDAEAWEAVADAHREAFGAAPPAATMVEVRRLVDRRLLVEVEALAVVPRPAPGAVAPRGDGSADYA
jgi:enamine deaminase RidA (YjgF/YER057c/UK114 family)